MNHTWENLDRIEAWKNGEMSKEEKEKFEFDLMHNEELSKEVELYDRLSEHIDSYGDLRTRRLISRVESKLEKEGFLKMRPSYNLWSQLLKRLKQMCRSSIGPGTRSRQALLCYLSLAEFISL
ncbi:MAG: hypothetical protein U0T81_13705 [Saprospiraceae bacterium]